MPSYNKFQDFTEQLVEGLHDFDAHTFKLALTNSAPTAGMAALSEITQISGGTGYTTGGATVTITTSESSGTTTVAGDQVVWTASGSMGPFRYYVLYNDSTTSPVADALIAWWDHGSAVTLASGETFTVNFNSDPTAGTIFTLA